LNSKAQVQANPGLDLAKWLVSLTLVVGGIYGFYHYAQYPMLYRVLALLPVVGLALWIAVLTTGGAAFWDLVKQARLEIYKVVWPTRPETIQTTLIVVAVVFLMAIILWLLDMFFGWLASLIIG
jgi:preprotein translocase subunit SecE